MSVWHQAATPGAQLRLEAVPVQMDVRLSPQQWAVAAMLTCVTVLDGLDLQLASFSAPALMREWHLTKPQFAPLLAAAMIGSAVGSLLGSWAADRIGRRPALVGSVLLFGLASIACAGAVRPAHFQALRLLSGLGLGAAFPLATTMMSEWMPRRAAGKAIGIMTVGIPAGAIIGAAGASWLLPGFGWRVCFIAAGGLCVACAALLACRLGETPVFRQWRGEGDDVRLIPAEAGDVSPVELLEREPPGRLVPDRPLFGAANLRLNLGLWLAVLCSSFATYAVGGWLTVILTDLHLPLAIALRGPITVSASAIVGAVASGWLLSRFGSRPAMLAWALLGLGSDAVMSLASYALLPAAALHAILFAGLAVGGFCTGALQPSFYVVAARAYGTRSRAKGIAVAAMLGRVGAIVSSFAGAAILVFGSQSGFFALIALLVAAAGAGVLLIDRHVPAGERNAERPR